MPFIDTYPEPFVSPTSSSRLNVILDILPDSLIDYEIWLPRVVVDGDEVLVRPGFSIDDALSKTASFELVNLADKDLFVAGASVDVGIGKQIGGVWDEASMHWEILDGSVDTTSAQISGTPQNVGDTFSVTIVSKSDDRLNSTSEAGLVIYDSNRVTISDSEFETIRDANGNSYTPEVTGISRLTLADLFQEILVNRCGFSSVETNLPANDWPIQRYSVGMGQRFYDGLKGFIGAYRPVTRIMGDVIGIYDSAIALPSGVPAPRQITIDSVEQLSYSTEQQRLDALMVQFTGVENNYDFTTPRFEYPSEASGDSVVDYERIWIEFRKKTSPGNSVVVREELNIENKTTSIDGEVVENSSEQFLFTSRGDVSIRTKTTESLLPTLPDSLLSLRKSREETEQFAYQAHPFKRRSTYCSRRSMVSSGLVTNDNDNLNIFGDPAKQEVNVALRSNNIAEGQVYTTQQLGSRIETAQPQRDGTVLTRVLITDEVNPSNSVDYFEKRPGDIGVSGIATTNEVVPVFADDVTARTAERIDDFPIGELPLRYGLSRARRELIFQRTKGRRLSLTHLGYDPSLQNGVPIAAYDREGNAIGNFLIQGRRAIVDRGLAIVLEAREIAGTTEPLQRLDNQISNIESGESVIWTLPIECSDGLELTIDPTSVANLSIEVRHVESPDTAWTDLESAALDLSPWDGSTEDFEFRFTADTVTAITRVQFDLLVRE